MPFVKLFGSLLSIVKTVAAWFGRKQLIDAGRAEQSSQTLSKVGKKVEDANKIRQKIDTDLKYRDKLKRMFTRR